MTARRQAMRQIIIGAIQKTIPGAAVAGMQVEISEKYGENTKHTWSGSVLGLADRIHTALYGSGEAEAAEETPLTVFRASHDSIVIERYTTAAEARKHCEALLRREEPDAELAWTEEEDDVQSLTFTVNGEFQDWSGYVVTRLEIASDYDPNGDE